MSIPEWSDLLPNIGEQFPSVFSKKSRLSLAQVEKLEKVDNATMEYGLNVSWGISAIGELLAHTANAGDLDNEVAVRIGWLINSLGELSVRLHEVGSDASHALETIEREEAVQ